VTDEWEGHWFNPVAFAERWLEEEWSKKRPGEFSRYIEGLRRREGRLDDEDRKGKRRFRK
jgi:hypothetical protein